MRLNPTVKNRSNASPISLPMTGMIDVVFLLLIFFLVTTSFDPPTRSRVTSVITDTNTGTDEMENDPPLMLTVYPDGQRIGYQLAGVRTTDEGEICKLLNQIRPSGEPILVKVTGGLPFQSAISAFDLCETCGHPSAAWYFNDER